MRITVKDNISEVSRYLTDVQRKQIPFAASQAINDTAFKLKEELATEMDKVFDNPRPYTKKAFRVKKSNKNNLTATVYLDESREYLTVQVEGGVLRPARRSFTVPIHQSMFRGQSNDLKRGVIAKILGSGGGIKKKYFAGRPRGRLSSMGDGIYQRMPRNPKSKNIRKLATMVPQKKYKRRLDFQGVGRRTVAKVMPGAMEKSLARALRTARR